MQRSPTGQIVPNITRVVLRSTRYPTPHRTFQVATRNGSARSIKYVMVGSNCFQWHMMMESCLHLVVLHGAL
jgi:hypothetical protein